MKKPKIKKTKTEQNRPKSIEKPQIEPKPTKEISVEDGGGWGNSEIGPVG